MQKLKHTVYKYKHIINKRWQYIARHVLIFWLLRVLIKLTIPKHHSQLKQSQIRWFGNSDISWSELIFNEDKHQLTWWQVTQANQIPEQHLAVFLFVWVKSPTLKWIPLFHFRAYQDYFQNCPSAREVTRKDVSAVQKLQKIYLNVDGAHSSCIIITIFLTRKVWNVRDQSLKS